jgi:hypothetical protein
MHEMADIEAFRSLSAFEEACVTFPTQLPTKWSFEPFPSFTAFITEVTNAERQQYRCATTGRTMPTVNVSMWLDRLTAAYDIAFEDMSMHQKSLSRISEPLMTVARSHYHANQVYLQQALASRAHGAIIENVKTSQHVKLILQDIEFTLSGAVCPFAHDIFWPLFIAGTESRGNEQAQRIVERFYTSAITMTGCWNNDTAFRFLLSFWQTIGHEDIENWIYFGRQCADQYTPFLIF